MHELRNGTNGPHPAASKLCGGEWLCEPVLCWACLFYRRFLRHLPSSLLRNQLALTSPFPFVLVHPCCRFTSSRFVPNVVTSGSQVIGPMERTDTIGFQACGSARREWACFGLRDTGPSTT